ncbi:unnamed protein product, partial [Didymodactylos carnosus]
KPELAPQQYINKTVTYAEDITVENQHEKLFNLLLPLWKTPYDEQLKIKQTMVNQTFEQIGRAILWDRRIDTRVLKHIEFRKGDFCHVESIIPSVFIENYRSKDDLSCGFSVDGQKTIGFYINSKNGKSSRSVCVPPLYLPNMKTKHKIVTKHLNLFIKHHSLAIMENVSENYMKKNQYWRSAIIKTNEKNELMLIIIVHPQTLSKDELNTMKQDLVNYFINGDGRECNITSLYFQPCAHSRCFGDYELLYGDEYLFEIYNGKKFRISVESPLVGNKQAMESVYELVMKHAQIDKDTIVLDIGGSGIGVYSVLSSPLAKRVYSIEPLQSAIADGQYNAKLNNCEDNIQWMYGFDEAQLHRVIQKVGEMNGTDTKIVAIVNPSRFDLSSKATAALRSVGNVQKLIYVSAKVDQHAMYHFYELSAGDKSKKTVLNNAFVLTKVYPVDAFPHTINSEVVIIFDRVN